MPFCWLCLVVVSVVSMGCCFFFSFFFCTSSAAATRAELPIPISVCSILMCPNSGMAASVWDFQHVHRH